VPAALPRRSCPKHGAVDHGKGNHQEPAPPSAARPWTAPPQPKDLCVAPSGLGAAPSTGPPRPGPFRVLHLTSHITVPSVQGEPLLQTGGISNLSRHFPFLVGGAHHDP
jgi:hypothetical protein